MSLITAPRLCTRTTLAVFATAVMLVASVAQAANKELSTWDKYQLYLKYQQAATTITEGEGLQNIKIGMQFAAVRKHLGKPVEQKGFHILSRARDWVYHLDPQTDLQLSGRKVVEKISVRGKPDSPYATVAGAHFGMPAFEIRTFYGTEWVQASQDTLDYPFRGVRFIFNNNILTEIAIYPPKRR